MDKHIIPKEAASHTTIIQRCDHGLDAIGVESFTLQQGQQQGVGSAAFQQQLRRKMSHPILIGPNAAQQFRRALLGQHIQFAGEPHVAMEHFTDTGPQFLQHG